MGLIERMHKFYAKIPASTSQKRGYVFLTQVAQRLQEQQMLTQARYMYQCDNVDTSPNNNQDTRPVLKSASARVVIKDSPYNHGCLYSWLGTTPPSHGLHPLIIKSVRNIFNQVENLEKCDNFLLHSLDGSQSVEIYTEAFIGGRIFRCHPDFQKEGPWYDWAMVTWEYSSTDVKFEKTKEAPAFWEPTIHSRRAKKKKGKKGLLQMRSYLIFPPICLTSRHQTHHVMTTRFFLYPHASCVS
jgi:hypothetical protein